MAIKTRWEENVRGVDEFSLLYKAEERKVWYLFGIAKQKKLHNLFVCLFVCFVFS